MAERVQKIEASAGSGKTHLLTREFLIRLFRLVPGQKPASPANAEELANIQRRIGTILAITFTNKAAGEMKERILTTLKRFSRARDGGELPPDSAQLLDAISDETGRPPESILAQAGRLVEIILSGYDDFHVRTIDSLMSNIIKVISPDLKLPADYCIKVDARDALHLSLLDFLAKETARDWPSASEFLGEYAALQGLRTWKLHEEIATVIGDLFHNLQLHPPPLPNTAGEDEDIRADYFRQRSLLGGHLDSLRALLASDPDETGWNGCLNRRRFTPQRLEALDSFISGGGEKELVALTFLAECDGDSLLKKECPARFGDEFGRLLEPVRRGLAAAFEALARYRLWRFNSFFSRFRDHWSRDRRILFVEEFSQTLHERFNDWQKSALPYLYLKLSDRYRHFLFDEFQDTSELQFKVLAPIVDEVLASQENASLFLVGDRKQAIYRWRGGNPLLMDEEKLMREIPALWHVAKKSFSQSQTENWRSADAIVETNNAFWNPQSLAAALDDEMLREAVQKNFSAAVQQVPPSRRGRTGYVRIDLRRSSRQTAAEDGDGRDGEEGGPAQAVHAAIEVQVRRCLELGFRPGDIAVLLRRNEHCRTLLGRLAEAGIAAVSDESLLLAQNPLASEILAAFRFLDYPLDNLDFYSFVSGDVFRGRALQLHGREMPGCDDRFFNQADKRPWYIQFRERFPSTWKDLVEPFFRGAGFLPVYDLFADWCMRFQVFENFPGDAAFFLGFSELLHRLEQDNIHSPAAFLAEWPRLEAGDQPQAMASPEDPSALRIMTVHQAKGLGFPAVIVGLIPGRPPPKRPIYFEGDRLYWIKSEYGRGSEKLAAIRERQRVQETIDELNLLYVAMTRAEKALFVIGAGQSNPQAEGSLAPAAIQSSLFFSHPLFSDTPKDRIVWEKGELKSDSIGERKSYSPDRAPAVQSKSVSTKDWQHEYLVFSQSVIRTDAEKAAIRRGDAVHRVLARLGAYETPDQMLADLADITAHEPLDAGDDRLLATFLTRPEVWRFFQAPVSSQSEKEWCQESEGQAEVRRIDRLVLGDPIAVLEFKTGHAKEPEHASQVRKYMKGIASLFPGRAVAGWLLYPDLGEVEEVPC